MNKDNVRTLKLPDGGTFDIPLPGGNSRFVMRPGSSALAGTPPRLVATILISVGLGLMVGVIATNWYLSRSRA